MIIPVDTIKIDNFVISDCLWGCEDPETEIYAEISCFRISIEINGKIMDILFKKETPLKTVFESISKIRSNPPRTA
jgi:hypothetical protein